MSSMTCILQKIKQSMPLIKTVNAKPCLDNVTMSGILNNQKVVAKMTPSSCENYNGMQAERMIYMYVANNMIEETPHVLKGLQEGKCSLTCFLTMKNIPSETKLRFLEIFKQKYETYLFDKKCVAKFKNYVNYIITPKINGSSLHNFVSENKKLMKLQNLEILFAMQMAQVLCVFAKHEFIHNDLHMDNIFVITHPQPKSFTYSFPFDFTTTSRYQIVIFDYDFASVPSVKNTSNDVIHLDSFQYNWDWYTFLTYFIDFLVCNDIKSRLKNFFPKDIFEFGTPLRKVGKNVHFGFALKCVEIDENNTCYAEYDYETLQKLPNPHIFLEFCLRDKNRQRRILTRQIV